MSNESATMLSGALLCMVGQDIVGDLPDDTSIYLNYVKTWTRTTDRGGLQHVSNDTYQFFLAIEAVLYQLVVRGETKDKVISEITTNENVRFLWEMATDLIDEKQSMGLLREVIELWFTIRGFSIPDQLLEQYKTATKSTIKGKKDLRKEMY